MRTTAGELLGQQISKTLRFFHNLTVALHDHKESKVHIVDHLSGLKSSHTVHNIMTSVDIVIVFCSEFTKYIKKQVNRQTNRITVCIHSLQI